MAIIDVVQWVPAPGVFAWKFPNSQLNNKTQLIVAEGQEATLINQGEAIGPFGPGRHVLNTDNYPILTNIIKLATGGVTPFTAEVWFVSKAFNLDIKWGTAGAIQIEDPKYHIMLPVRAFGQYGLVVENSSKFLIKLIGMIPAFTERTLSEYFRGIVGTMVKDIIAKHLVEKGISILHLSAHLSDISSAVEEQVAERLEDYGVRMVNFMVNSISTDENDEAVKRLRKALAEKAEMDIIGYNYQQKRSFDTIETAAGNQGNGNMMNVGMGMGMGVGMGMPMGNAMAGLMGNINMAPPVKCLSCGMTLSSDTVFCPHCGKSTKKQEGITCDKCGKVSPPGTKFCAYCGDIFFCCPACGADNDGNASNCVKCGAALPKICPQCHSSVSAGAKFCAGCGYKMVALCSVCGKELSSDSKFCPECGAKKE